MMCTNIKSPTSNTTTTTTTTNNNNNNNNNEEEDNYDDDTDNDVLHKIKMCSCLYSIKNILYINMMVDKYLNSMVTDSTAWEGRDIILKYLFIRHSTFYDLHDVLSFDEL